MPQFTNLSDYLPTLNKQIAAVEFLLSNHQKANAMLETALSHDDFLHQPKFVIHDFLCVLSDIIKQADNLTERLLDSLLQIAELLAKPPKKQTPGSDDAIH